MDLNKTYTVKLTGLDLDRIQYVFEEEETAYESNPPSEDNTALLKQTRSVLKKVNQAIKEAA